MGDQPNRPDNAQDQHDHEIPVTRVPHYVPPEHLDLVHDRYFDSTGLSAPRVALFMRDTCAQRRR